MIIINFLPLIMQTLTITVIDAKALRLLEDLESLNLIRVVKNDTHQPKQRLSEKYLGKLPSQVAESLQDYVTQSRKEWNSRGSI
jgi:hypothetical protein